MLLNGTSFEATLADDRALKAFVRQSVFGVWHPVGTCRMADASIMPKLPTANTNIPVIMAAEKISGALLRHHRSLHMGQRSAPTAEIC